MATEALSVRNFSRKSHQEDLWEMAPRLSSPAYPTKPELCSVDRSRRTRKRRSTTGMWAKSEGRARLRFCFQHADGGGRTHTTLRSLDFESSASANSATSAYLQGRMVYRFLKKRKGLIAHFHNHASIATTAVLTPGVDSRRKKNENQLCRNDLCLRTLVTFGQSLRCRS